MGNGYICLDTRAFDAAIASKEKLINLYNQINGDYDRVVNGLLQNWKGNGADAFQRDAQTVRSNLVGIYDILKIMCDTLVDCKAVFAECDKALGEYNTDPR